MSRASLVVLAGAVAVVTVVVANRHAGQSAPAAADPWLASSGTEPIVAPAPASTPSPDPGPTTVVAGVPMGYAHSPAGAKAAAVEFTAAAGALVAMDEADALEAQATMAAAAAAEELVASLRDQLRELRESFAGPVTYRVAPVATRLSPVSADEVAVAVWYVGVVVVADLGPYEDWRTVRYRLVWERDDWRVAAESDTRGPRPTAPPGAEPTPPAEFAAALAGFTGPGELR
ncbi:MAG: hypothetical protein KY439_00150 [Actinobacteria bacterium]|nr:hypothetical protein [Actinomycetota bacterium]